MWLLRLSISLQALVCVRVTKELAVFSIDIALMHPNNLSCPLTQNWHELPIGCYWNTFVKQDFDSLLSWDLMWLASPAWNKQTLLQMLQTCSGCKVSGTKVKFCFQSACVWLKSLILHASNSSQFLQITFFQNDWFTIICFQSPTSIQSLFLSLSYTHTHTHMYIYMLVRVGCITQIHRYQIIVEYFQDILKNCSQYKRGIQGKLEL